MKRFSILLLLIAGLLLISGSVLAMASPNYKIDWYIPLSGGGGSASSANYQVDFTVGQSVTGASAGAESKVQYGYWPGTMRANQVYMPSVVR